jgi:hypothetical protein
LEVTQTLAYTRPDRNGCSASASCRGVGRRRRRYVGQLCQGLFVRGKKLTSVFVNARLAEALVGMPIILGEIEVVLDELSADKGVVADTIAAHPRIEERECEHENQAQEKLSKYRELTGQEREPKAKNARATTRTGTHHG